MASSGLAALDVVLRNREAVAALPEAVRLIRRFADVPLAVKLRFAMRPHTSVAKLEAILEMHREDLRLDAIESGWPQHKPAPHVLYDTSVPAHEVLVYGARHGSARVVDLVLELFSGLNSTGLLRTAIIMGNLEIVQALHQRERRLYGERVTDDATVMWAATFGHVEIVEWVHTTFALSCFPGFAARRTAANGHLSMLQWVHANCSCWHPSLALAEAAVHNHVHILDWIDSEHVGADPSSAMTTLATEGENPFSALTLLHKRYPGDRISARAVRDLRAGSQRDRDVVGQVLAAFPERYAELDDAVAIISTDSSTQNAS